MKKKPMNPMLLHFLLSVSTLIGILVLAVVFFNWQAGVKADTNKELDLFYMYGNRTGAYFLEPKAEYENLIYVSQSDLNDWDITPTETGQKFTGIFDPTGWDLITLKHKEEK